MKIEKLFIPILFILLFLFIIFAPYKDSFTLDGNIYINEVMSSNKTTVASKNGKYYDYIEIYNGNDYDVNLDGYYLTDDYSNAKKYRLSDVNVKAKDYLLVYASGLNTSNEGEIHTNFKIDTKGEVIMLFDDNNKVLSKLSMNSMISDIAYGYNGKEYVYYYNGTPGKENAGEYSKNPITSIKDSIDITFNEYILDNVSSVKAKDGKYYSIVELYNNGDADVNLEGFYLTDDPNDLQKYVFPSVVIKSKGYLKVFGSGLNKLDGDELHTNFKLENNGNSIILLNNKKKIIDNIKLQKLGRNITCGKYKNRWNMYQTSTFGEENKDDYIKDTLVKEVIINEVGAVNPEGVELKNITNMPINLNSYSISDKSGKIHKFGNITIQPGAYLSFDSTKLGFSIGTLTEVIYLYKNDFIVDEFRVDKLKSGITTGLDGNGNKVYFRNHSLGKVNSKTTFKGYATNPVFSIDGGYVKSGTSIELSGDKDSKIYYTLDGSFPTKASKLYTGPITISKNTVVKAIAYRDGYIESDTISRTYLTGRKHDLAVISMSTNRDYLYGNNGLFSNYTSILYKKTSFEFYENDGTFGTEFIGDVKLSGNVGGSRDKAQKAMTFYLRKAYGNNTVRYPLFKDNDLLNYSSILLRNGGEDYLDIHIFDAALQMILKGQMDLDMQDYRPVVLYINGEYYGISNMRDKLNSDYVSNKFDVDKNDLTLIKYTTAIKGSWNNFNSLLNYVKSHDVRNKDVYAYLKTQIDMQELCNYWVAQSFYGNTDLGNIKYWKDKNGKWRFMYYDIDWSLYYTQRNFNYPVMNVQMPAVTYVYQVVDLTRTLYKNSEFRDLYLKTLAYHLKNTFTPSRTSKIVDQLAKEIESEVPYHTARWSGTNSSLGNINSWKNKVENLKNRLNIRYNFVKANVKSSFNLSDAEYKKYFG